MQTSSAAPVHSPAFRIVDLLQADELAAMGDAIHETVDNVARALRTPYADSAPEQDIFHRLQTIALTNPVYASALLSAVYADAHLDPRINSLQHNPKVLAAIAQVSGPFEPTGMTVRVRVNIPAMPQTLHGWHSDVAIATPVRADSTCHTVLGACWIPLCDTDANNGGLELVTAQQHAPLDHTRTETGRFVIPDALLDGLPRLKPAVRAGEAAVIGRYTPHRSLPTTGPRVRWSVVAWVKGVRA